MEEPNKNYWIKGAFNQLVDDYLNLLTWKGETSENEKSLNAELKWVEHKLIGWAIQHVDISQLNLTSHDSTSN